MIESSGVFRAAPNGSVRLLTIVGGEFSSSDLSGASLENADLSSVTYHNTLMKGASLTGANLTGNELNFDETGYILKPDTPIVIQLGLTQGEGSDAYASFGVKLGGAQYNEQTTWPQGFDPTEQSFLIIVESAPDESPDNSTGR